MNNENNKHPKLQLLKRFLDLTILCRLIIQKRIKSVLFDLFGMHYV